MKTSTLACLLLFISLSASAKDHVSSDKKNRKVASKGDLYGPVIEGHAIMFFTAGEGSDLIKENGALHSIRDENALLIKKYREYKSALQSMADLALARKLGAIDAKRSIPEQISAQSKVIEDFNREEEIRKIEEQVRKEILTVN